MAFTKVQTNTAGIVSGGTPFFLTMTNKFGSGNLVVAGIISNHPLVGLVVTDENGNFFNLSLSSPTGIDGTTGISYMAWRVMPNTAGKQVKITWTSGTQIVAILAGEFSFPGAASVLVVQDFGVTGTASGTSINTPSLTPTATGHLLFALGNPNASITAPTSGGSLGGWTGGGIDPTTSAAIEFIQNSSTSATPVAFTDSVTSDPYSAIAMEFAASVVGDQGPSGPSTTMVQSFQNKVRIYS